MGSQVSSEPHPCVKIAWSPQALLLPQPCDPVMRRPPGTDVSNECPEQGCPLCRPASLPTSPLPTPSNSPTPPTPGNRQAQPWLPWRACSPWPLNQELPSEWDTHSLEFSAPFRKLPSWPLAFSFARPYSISIATASPSLGASPQFCPPLLSTALQPISSVWVGSGISSPGPRPLFPGPPGFRDPFAPLPQAFQVPRLNDWPGFPPLPFLCLQ